MMPNSISGRPDAKTRNKRGAGVSCEHDYPIVVTLFVEGGGQREARCLGCWLVGPVVRGDAETARQALLATVSHLRS